MQKLDKKTKMVIIVIGLLITSGCFFYEAGWNNYVGTTAYNSEKNSQTKTYMAHEVYSGKYGIPATLHGISNSTTVTTNPYTHIQIVNTTITKITIKNATYTIPFYAEFTSPEVFAVDNNINYTIEASTYPVTNIKDFYFVFDASLNNFYQYKDNVNTLMKVANETGELVKLERENDTFFTKINANWTSSIEDRISLFSIVVDDQNNKKVSAKTPVLFTISPHLAKLQADTNLDIQRQSLQSIQTNTSIVTLTWVLIALIPLGFVVEIIVHGYLVKPD